MQWLKNPLILVLLSGILLGISWPPYNLLPGLFIGFVPLLILIQLKIGQWRVRKFYPWFFLSFAVFNGIAQWWVACIQADVSAKILGFLSPVLVNGVIMSLTLCLFVWLKKKIGNKLTDWSLLFVWCAMEYLHAMDWDLSWPWMFLGNGLGDFPWLYQFYEYTGNRGGTFFVLLINLSFFKACWFLLEQNKKGAKAHAINGILKFSLFALVSIGIGSKTYEGETIGVRIIQPNIDPYTTKFDASTEEDQIVLMNQQAFTDLKEETKLIVFPETALPYGGWEDEFKKHPGYKLFSKSLQKYPDKLMIIGASTYRRIENVNLSNVPMSYRQLRDGGYYEAYNSTVYLEKDKHHIYHKSRLVAGAEQLPFASYFSVLKNLAVDLGGTSGVLGKQTERFVYKKDSLKVAGIICYEADYGEYTSKFVNNDANLLAVITNDAWWQDSPGYKQHFTLSRIRAVENRRFVARSANTGISGVIDEKGEIVAKTKFNELAVLDENVKLIKEKTFFVKHGDVTGRLCLVFTIFFTLMALLKKYKDSVSILRK